jgi:hypothetical protein
MCRTSIFPINFLASSVAGRRKNDRDSFLKDERDLLEIEPAVKQILPSELIIFDDDDASHRHQNRHILRFPFGLA